MREDITHHMSGLIRGVCLSQMPMEATITISEEWVLQLWRWDISENVIAWFHGFLYFGQLRPCSRKMSLWTMVPELWRNVGKENRPFILHDAPLINPYLLTTAKFSLLILVYFDQRFHWDIQPEQLSGEVLLIPATGVFNYWMNKCLADFFSSVPLWGHIAFA